MMAQARRKVLWGLWLLAGPLIPKIGNGQSALTERGAKLLSTSTYVNSFGGTWDGVSDISAYAQAALDSGERIIDFKGLPGKITSSLKIPEGVEAKNVNLIAGSVGMKMLLVSSNSRVSGVLTGTGATNGVNEWGVYPVSAGVNDVQLELSIRRVSVGVQIWNGGNGVMPQRWRGKLRFSELVGGGKGSNGYGLLLAGGANCKFEVFSENTPRHCVYLSNGARGNEITLHSTGSGGAPVQLAAYKDQPYVEENKIVAFVSKMKPSSSASAYAANFVGRVQKNRIELEVDSSSAALGAVLFRALDENSVPSHNFAAIKHNGGYAGGSVVQSDSAFENAVEIYGEGYSSANNGGVVISANNYNGISRPHGKFEKALIVKKFSWNAQGKSIRGIGAFASYAPVEIDEEAVEGLKSYGEKMFATSGGGRVVQVKRLNSIPDKKD